MRQSRAIVMAGVATLVILVAGLGPADSGRQADGGEKPAPLDFSEEPIPDTRKPLDLAPAAGREHRAVMLQHLETVQAIVAALAAEDYELAKGLTETHLGFFMHRQAMARQKAEDFPPAYHDLAMAHHEAAEELARAIPSRNLKQILPRLDLVLKTCVNCHLSYRVPAR